MRLAVAAAVLGLAGCLTVADDRARRDREIGRASLGGLAVEVEDGLGHVRELSAGAMTLWAQAPVLRLTITRAAGDPGGPLELTFDNVLADAQLTVEGGPAPEPVALPAEEARVTRKRWRLAPASGAATRLLLTPPDAADQRPFRVGVFADVQERLRDVGDIYARMSEDPSIRFVLMNGDLTNRGTVEQLRQFQREMRKLPVPIYTTLGNHELGKRDDLFHEYFGRGNFSFVFRGARFTLLDSASATLSPLTYESLEGWLAGGAAGFHMVGMHIPPFDPVGVRGGGFSSRLEAAALCAKMAAAGVDLTIYGHVHSFYSYVNAGIPAYITGGGGAIPERFDGIGRHFMTVDVDPTTSVFQVGLVRVD